MAGIKLIRTASDKQVGKEGLLLGDDNKPIYDDSWLHPEVFDEEHEKTSNRKLGQLSKSESLYIDLEKALNRGKLVQKRTMVRGKNGKIYYRMQWVDPNTGQPVGEHQSVQAPKDESQMTRKEFIDHKLSKMSREEKYDLINKHGVDWKRNNDTQIDHKNAIMALKDHLHKNPHHIGAGHLPESSDRLPTNEEKVDAFVKHLGKHDRAKMYELMKRHGIADGDPALLNPDDKAHPIKHMHNAMKLKKFLKDNPHLMDQEDTQPRDVNPKPELKPKSEEAPIKSKAEQGGNTIEGVLKRMSDVEKYELMKRHGIADSDPRLNPNDKTAPIKHMGNMIKLKKLIESDPSILNLGEDGGLSEHEQNRLNSMKGNEEVTQRVKDFLGAMSKEKKQELLDHYADHDIMKNRKKYDNENIDYMHAVTSLRKIFEEKPELMDDHKDEVENAQLMKVTIGNKNMGRILRHFLGLKGVGDVKNVEAGVEWSWESGFARRETDEDGKPILSVVDFGKKGDEWNEHIIPLKSVKEFLDNQDAGDKKDSTAAREEVQEATLDQKPPQFIWDALNKDFDANYTDKVGEAVQPLIRNWYEAGTSNNISDIAVKAIGMTVKSSALKALLERNNVPVNDLGNIDTDSEGFNRYMYGHEVEKTKSKHADEYLRKDYKGQNVTWLLHESAKLWAPEQRAEARKDMINTRIHVPDEDKHPDDDVHKGRVDHLTRHLHKSLEYVPFDLMTDILAANHTFRFTKKTYNGHDHYGNHYVPGKNIIEFNHQYYTDTSGLMSEHPFEHMPGNNWNFSETASHEFAHAIDNYLSGFDGMGKWDSKAAEKYVPEKYRNVIRDSYRDAVEGSNPDKYMGFVDRGRNHRYYYHKDNWLATYEGRIYDQAYTHTDPDWVARHVKIENGQYKDLKFDKHFRPNNGWGAGIEHWSENVQRYADAMSAYQRWRENGNDGSIEEWAEQKHDSYHSFGYRGEEEDESSGGGTIPYRRGVRTRPDTAYGWLYDEVRMRHPRMLDGIKAILGRSDFVDIKGRDRHKRLNDGDFQRKSESLELFIDLEGDNK